VKGDLDAAIPELEAAKKSLEALDKNAIIEIKSFPNPPKAVVLVMEAVMILLGEKIDWASCRNVISNPGEFLEKLKTYDV
jgi:dynein heavy chain